MEMAILQTFLVCLFALTDTLVEPTEGTEAVSDIYKFLSANPKVWVYNTSEGNKGNITCRRDILKTITPENITFERYNNTSIGELLKGKFVNWNDPKNKSYDAMYVNDTDDNPVTDEVIEYVSRDNHCAVVSVTLMTTVPTVVLRELRVSEAILQNGPDEECKENFKNILKEASKEAISHYSPTCRAQLN
uniref:Putative lipocalin-3 1 n=1 Tax=Amblyomma americanum TaxID=6943 RepID=A0A0C9RXQ4_AMBAM